MLRIFRRLSTKLSPSTKKAPASSKMHTSSSNKTTVPSSKPAMEKKTPKLVLVIGITSFLGGHVTHQLIEKGYHVRGTARQAKIQSLRDTIKLPGLEFVEIDDVATADFTEVLKGVYAVIHLASPLPARDSAEITTRTTVEGTLNILRQAEKASIEKVVVTGSFGNVIESNLYPAFGGLTFTESDWPGTTAEQVRENGEDPFFTYFGNKVVAEKAAWDYVKEHPSLDLTTMLPAFFYGPWAAHFPFPPLEKLGTNGWLYMISKGLTPPAVPPFSVDVRDVAKAHILALDLPRMPLQEKRFIIASDNFSWKEAAAHLKKVRPDTTSPLDPDSFPPPPGPVSTLDNSRAKQVLKMEFTAPQKTLEDLVDTFGALEKSFS